ncbi:rpel repeat [Trichoderma cornu-damae]|uniref:Rpel repeat n=1 Tax=Trichoderma cornu-damae TaxID=654480 RepID=A0A9P8QUU1_9HYPO|nr:rpel repeat [Trichoderma cornu-damae]
MADTTESQVPAVDETPISSVRTNTNRKNSLSNYLKHRPERSELVGKNILPDSTAAPGLIASQRELQKHMLGDKLNDKISHRPTPDALLKDGVLHQDPRSPDEQYDEAIELEYAKREGGA